MVFKLLFVSDDVCSFFKNKSKKKKSKKTILLPPVCCINEQEPQKIFSLPGEGEGGLVEGGSQLAKS